MAKFGDWEPDQRTPASVKPTTTMRTERDIHLLIDYLRARDPQHPDIGILCWVLSEQPNVEANEQMTAERAQWANTQSTMNGIITAQFNEIVVLKEKLARFVTPPTRMQP